MEKTNFEGLEPEIFFAQPWFADFAEVYAAVLDDRIRYPIYQLETIRSVTGETDTYVVTQTLKQIGFDLPSDFIRHNTARLSSAIPQLVLYSERSGTEDFTKSMSFILGRSIDATALYTQDYVSFYPQPYGPLQVDGGNWYKTTHVELGMQYLPTDYNLLLPRNKTIKDRFLDAFFEFAPWNIVVESFYFTINLEIPLHLIGTVVKHPKRYLELGESALQLTDLQIVGPDTLIEHTTQEFELVATYANETDALLTQKTNVQGNWTSSKPAIVSWTRNTAQLAGVSLDTDVVLYAEYEGRSVSKTVKVKNDTNNVQSIEIVGPTTLYANDSATYTVVAHTHDGDETLTVPINAVSPYGYMQGNVLTAYQNDADSKIVLHASIVLPNGVELVAAKEVTALWVDPNVYLVSLEIEGPAEFYEHEQKDYTCIARFSDGSERGVLAVWDSGCGSVFITPSGELYANSVEADLPIVLRATHQHKQVVLTAELPVVFRKRTISIVHTEIIGSNRVIELQRYRFATIARFSDGSTGEVEAEWSSDKFYINDQGILEVGSVGTTPVPLTIRSSVEGIKAIKQVTAIDTPVTLDNVLVLGPDNLREGSTGKFAAYAHYSNGRDVEIQPEWSIVGAPKWATIDQNGMLAFKDPQVSIVEVLATYRISGRVLTQSKPVVLIPETTLISGMIISGPNSVFDGERIVLTATAVYADGSTKSVSPSWTVQSADPMNEPEAMADIVSPGVLQGRYVEKNTVVVAVARYFKEVVEFEIVVKPREISSPDKPESSRIIGPPTIYSDQRGSFAHMIKFEECNAEIGVSSDWSIDVPADVAQIDGAGFLWSNNGRSATLTVTSTYQCGTYTVIDSIVVNILGQVDTLKALQIEGPDTVIGGNQTLYLAKLFKVGEPVEPGKGTIVTPTQWSIVGDSRATVNGSGQVYVSDASAAFSFILKAMYQEGFEKVEATKEIHVLRDARPIFGLGPVGVRSDAEITQYLTESLPTLNNNQRFTLTAPAGKYMYFCYPTTLGKAEFTDVASNFVGGWDGASWPDDGSTGDQYGPIAITRTNELGVSSTWYLYRTDFDGIGTYTYEVTFGH